MQTYYRITATVCTCKRNQFRESLNAAMRRYIFFCLILVAAAIAVPVKKSNKKSDSEQSSSEPLLRTERSASIYPHATSEGESDVCRAEDVVAESEKFRSLYRWFDEVTGYNNAENKDTNTAVKFRQANLYNKPAAEASQENQNLLQDILKFNIGKKAD